ncbi:MAG: isoprenoid biosynthesis glyoxalase ElbB [Candidatus Omnitrophota bacterium]|nr:isoprenoid biosynthesis glyoxalase ElbB [Candidatus Omnitrophota bacterium]MDZ4242066.1 isoprenoid biosynthesis glyoxalase ElbB [Candidatus Omnitrophota bacterium]
MNKANFRMAVVLSGCGVKDGSEIHEAVLSLLAVVRAGGAYQCFAPDIVQPGVVNHLSGEAMKETRRVLVEAARIARGKIKPLSEFRESEFDGLLLPGGYGASMNLCSFGTDGPGCSVNPDVEKAVKAMHRAGKPVGALCIAPVILAKVLNGVQLTVGRAPDVDAALVKMGAVPKPADCSQVVVDERNKVVTAPCYMFDADIGQVADGARNAVDAMVRLMNP